MKRKEVITVISLKDIDRSMASTSSKKYQIDNEDDMISILVDNISAIVMGNKNKKVARECSCMREKGCASKLNEVKTTLAPAEKERQ